MVTLDKIKSISKDDADIGLNYGHYKPIADLINKNNFKNIIEIGCAYGNLAEYLLNNTTLEKLYSVDPYTAYPQMPCVQTQDDYDLMFGYATEKLKKYKNKFELIRQRSEIAITYFLNKNINFIFLDGNHVFEEVKWEIEHYSKILKPNSILSGHDITVFEGVDKAVNEYKVKSGKELFVLSGNVWYFKM